MSRAAPLIELTTMVMVRDAERALVIDRVKSWPGISFPGGRLDPGESLAQCAVREVREETGLSISTPEPCGVIHWMHRASGARYFAFLFRTSVFTGALRSGTDEGRVIWLPVSELLSRPSSNGFRRYLPLFLEGGGGETFIPWDDADPYGNGGA